jgi:hypothetical protein
MVIIMIMIIIITDLLRLLCSSEGAFLAAALEWKAG